MSSDKLPDMASERAERLGSKHVQLEVVIDGVHHPGAKQLCTYWESRKGPDGTVQWPAIKPGEIVNLLQWLFLAEPFGSEWRYRLFGTGLRDRLRFEWTGKTTNEIFEPDAAAMVNDIYRRVSETKQPVNLRGRFVGVDLEHAAAEGVNLPVIGRDGKTPLVLGGVFFDGIFSHEFLKTRS